ncbi:hypothetical protein C1H46_023918 [Malus baccata]|uniref:Uncharacterized protein n=1 Tax=Malus baccata TaxID=106549 RepID=A0A540LVF5_MALBA|nr:hypothetical protein C1H46_023918 [Malus baccata]
MSFNIMLNHSLLLLHAYLMGKMQSLADYSDVSSKSSEPIARITEVIPVGRQWNLQLKANDEDNSYKKSETDNTRKADSLDERT